MKFEAQFIFRLPLQNVECAQFLRVDCQQQKISTIPRYFLKTNQGYGKRSFQLFFCCRFDSFRFNIQV